jgi:hypothetical protein
MPSLPVQNPTPVYHTLEDIRQRKEQLYKELQHDSQQFSTLWGQVFKSRKDSNRSEFIGSVVANSVTAVDVFLLIRKLLKTYGKVFKKGKKK